MKTKFLSLVAVLLSVLSFSSCDDSPWVNADKEGQVRLSDLDVEVSNQEKVIGRASYDVSDFIVTITNQSGAVVSRQRYAELPEILTLPVGKYTVNVVSHDVQKAEWEKPYFKGSQSFEITDGKITTVDPVVCKFSSLKVSIKYSEDLLALMAEDAKVTVIANDNGMLEYGKTETRAGYFEVVDGSTTLVATFSGRVKDTDVELRKVYSDIAAGQHRIITFSLKSGDPTQPDVFGTIDPTTGTYIDVTYEDEDLGGNVGSDEEIINPGTRPGQEGPNPGGEGPDVPNPPGPDNPDDPTTEAATFTTANPLLDLNGVNNASELDGTEVIVKIDCPKLFASLIVTIDSDGLTEEVLGDVGLAKTFDLASPATAELAEGLSGLGLPCGDEVKGQSSCNFDITQFMSLLGIYPGSNKFIIEVTDQAGNHSKLTLVINS
ncbi:MAG: DUF4493 domain-containing protein [Muribaculaceae bacterium]|nr:DUF4493 domain-containing protein [Muribaculaceae bacterium]